MSLRAAFYNLVKFLLGDSVSVPVDSIIVPSNSIFVDSGSFLLLPVVVYLYTMTPWLYLVGVDFPP